MAGRCGKGNPTRHSGESGNPPSSSSTGGSGPAFVGVTKEERIALTGRMIARLHGILAETSVDGAIVDVQGVGYQVQASSRTLDALGPIGGDVTILTELQVREDGWTLFGFGSAG